MKVYSINFDNVIKSSFITASTNYKFAIDNLVPLIDRLDIQRNIQDSKFYSRLETDLVKGCIMPALTLAFIDSNAINIEDITHLETYVTANIQEGFILDGIQRLNTLQRTFKKNENLDLDRILFINILICSSMDNLLYRMITLNNGQKPMSARHQIEILTTNLFEFESEKTPIITERDSKREKIKVSFNKADFIKGYLAFLANSTNIENQKIIEEKLDALIADKILESNITEDDLEFSLVVEEIKRLSENEKSLKWFRNANNLIGFCVGIKKSFETIKNTSINDFEKSLENFEKAFTSFNISKIKVSRQRRANGNYFIQNYDELKNASENDLIDILSQID
ncbi:hypothetical protein [Flavobacterium sp. PL002]|uniref:hypothetical protein n=1 Tax=Flavobacterium sp. PL002 TaxID=1897058 RepID=UPI001787E3A6|nr:hypothetical protein [Flavobacterium sp. PL002]MBE0393886.1 hypothetical protein [Flavobacterium sp. PL002]